MRCPLPLVAGVLALTLGAAGCLAPGEGSPGPVTTRPGPEVGVQYHGLWTSWSDTERTVVLDRLADAGVGWVRVDVGWTSVEEQGPGQESAWYLDRLETTVTDARARGLSVLATLWATPSWANGGGARETPPDDEAQYARAARSLAQRFRGRVAAWEVWNEPNSPDFFAGSAADYARLLRAAYPAIKVGDPAAEVVLGGTSYNDSVWLRQAYAAGIHGSFDVLATHPYLAPSDVGPEQPDDGSTWTLAHVRVVRALMQQYGDGGLPIWFTELGWSTHANGPGTEPWERGVSEAQQADYLVRALDLVRVQYPYVTHVFWYSARDRTDSNLQNNNYGLLRSDLRPKPAYDALLRSLT